MVDWKKELGHVLHYSDVKHESNIKDLTPKHGINCFKLNMRSVGASRAAMSGPTLNPLRVGAVEVKECSDMINICNFIIHRGMNDKISND